MRKRIFAGIDVGGTKIALGLVSDRGRIIARAKTPTPKDASPETLTRLITDLLNGLLRDMGCRRLAGIGVGVPGIVDQKGEIVRTPNINLSRSRLRPRLEKRFRARTVVGNDVNLGVLGEQWLGAARNAKNVVGIFVGTGVGGGIVVDGRLMTGLHGAAAEIGHMAISPEGPKCSCGNRGCLEALCGRWAMERDIRAAVAKGKKTVLAKFVKGKRKPLKSKILRKALNKKDPLTIAIMTRAAKHLGAACVSLCHIFDPEVVVLGGGVMEACGDFMLPIIKKAVRKDKLFSGLRRCEIASSRLGDDAVILGGVALASGRV